MPADKARAAYDAAVAKVNVKIAAIKAIEGDIVKWTAEREKALTDLAITPDAENVIALIEFVDNNMGALKKSLDEYKEALAKAEKRLAALPKPAAVVEPAPVPEAVATPPGDMPTPDGVAVDAAADVAPQPERIFMIKEKVMAYHPYDHGRNRKLKPGKVIMRSTKEGVMWYLVHFIGKEYQYPDGKLKNEKHEVPADEVKPNFAADKARAEAKRKADEDAAAAAQAKLNPPTKRPYSSVISGPASINTDLLKREPSKVSDGPAKSETYKKRKLESRKAYDTRANTWKDFQAHGKIAPRAKNAGSMFRTEENNPNSRVGFVGSGRGMTETRARVKHHFEPDQYDEDDY